jgi:putative glycosyltransferase (TIGR04372 family)
MNFIKQLLKVPVLVVSVIVLLVAKLVQPVVRFQLCIVGFHRYGHLALEPEIFLAEKEIAKENRQAKKRVISIWSLGPTSKQSNRFLAKKWKEELPACPSWLVSSLYRAGSIFSFLKLDQAKLSITGSMNGLDKTDSHMSLSSEEMEEGRRRLVEIGISPDKPYVCLIVRDGGHYQSKGDTESLGYELINFDINHFASAATELIANGYQVVRMGSGSERPFTKAPAGVIDYALSDKRSEFLDVYLAATCTFAISTQTGPDAVCMLFRRPVLYVEVTRFSQFFFGSKFATWSPVRLQQNGKVLNLSEIVKSEIAWFKDPNLFAINGVTQQKSSELELKDLVSAYIQNRDIQPVSASGVQELVAKGMGERGRLQFGEVTAKLLPNVEQVLGEWVLK